MDDIAKVYRIGNQLFQTQETSTFYRTWDTYRVPLSIPADVLDGCGAANGAGSAHGNPGFLMMMAVR